MSSISSSPFPRLHGSQSHSCLCHAIIIYWQLWSLEVNIFSLFMEAWLLLQKVSWPQHWSEPVKRKDEKASHILQPYPIGIFSVGISSMCLFNHCKHTMHLLASWMVLSHLRDVSCHLKLEVMPVHIKILRKNWASSLMVFMCGPSLSFLICKMGMYMVTGQLWGFDGRIDRKQSGDFYTEWDLC